MLLTWDEECIIGLRQQMRALSELVTSQQEQIARLMDELTTKRQDWALAETEKVALTKQNRQLAQRVRKAEEYNRYLTRATTVQPIPFEQFPAPKSTHAPADLSVLVAND